MTKKKDKYNRILAILRERAKQEGSLPPVFDVYNKLLGLQTETKSQIKRSDAHLDQEAATDRLKQGGILLSYEVLPLDWILVTDLFRAIGQFIADHITHEEGDATLYAALASDSQVLQQAIRLWFEGKPLDSVADERQISGELLSSAIQATLYPFLVVQAQALQPLVRHELWRRRYCPVCGGKPDLAYLDKERGARWLLCSRCDTEWLFQRLECPYCGTQSQTDLAYYTGQDSLYRLYTCKKCQTYIKAIDLRRSSTEVLLPLERVVTASLDKQGVEAGFRPG